MGEVLYKILEELEHEILTNKEIGRKQCEGIAMAINIIRSHIDEVENDERLIKKYVTNRHVVKDFLNTPLYVKGCCPKCGCELKSCETDYCRACGQALRWDNPEGGL